MKAFAYIECNSIGEARRASYYIDRIEFADRDLVGEGEGQGGKGGTRPRIETAVEGLPLDCNTEVTEVSRRKLPGEIRRPTKPRDNGANRKYRRLMEPPFRSFDGRRSLNHRRKYFSMEGGRGERFRSGE